MAVLNVLSFGTRMWFFIGQVIWFFLPAGIANMGASMSRFLPVPAWPVDGGRTWRGKRILGSHKTWRGVITGLIIGTVFFYLQQWLYHTYGWAQDVSLIDYSSISIAFPLLLGAGALIGDMVKSIAKRQMSIDPGVSWMPFDQIDYVVGAAGFVSFVIVPTWQMIGTALAIGFGLHILVNLIAYSLHIQKNKL